MAGSFVVKAKIQRVGRVYGIADFNDTTVETVPSDLQRRIWASCERGGVVRQPQGIRVDRVLNIREHQLLVLLLVVQAQYDASRLHRHECDP